MGSTTGLLALTWTALCVCIHVLGSFIHGGVTPMLSHDYCPLLPPTMPQRYLSKAADVFLAAAATNASSVSARMGYASAMFQLGRSHNAATMAALTDVLALDAQHSLAYALAGAVFAELGDVDTAMQQLRQAVALQPSNALYRCDMAGSDQLLWFAGDSGCGVMQSSLDAS